MQSFLQFVNAGIGHFNRLIGWGLALLLLVMTVLIFWQVFARFVVGSPLFFSDEIARFSMLWLTFIGAGYAYRKGTLISVDIVLEYCGERLGRLMRILVVLWLGAVRLRHDQVRLRAGRPGLQPDRPQHTYFDDVALPRHPGGRHRHHGQ